MIKIKNKSVIYVVCPPNEATGGTELLHQLSYELNNLGYESKIYYGQNVSKNPTPKRFQKYNVSIAKEIEDNKDNVIVIPEVLTEYVNEFKNVIKAIWWLSVDNYFITVNRKKNRIKRLLGLYKPYNIDPDDKIEHFVQSYYAWNFLNDKNIHNISFLSDYLNDDYLNDYVDYTSQKRENICFYNPKKGYEFTKKIIDNSKNIKWVPLENMSVSEIKEILKKGKVYIDFGNHPGKDRFPREAAISGCCIITGKRGAANFYKDIPIDDKYKFNDKVENIQQILESIKLCLKNYDNEIKNFAKYRKLILGEKKKFQDDLLNIFNKEGES